MPFSERKGRFLVTTACSQPVSLGAAAIPSISAANSDQRVQKRKYGRFTVSTCQAYASSSPSPAVEDTLAARSGEPLQLTMDHRSASFSSLSSNERDASPFAVADQQQHHQQQHQACDLSMSSWDSSSSLCSKGSLSSCATAKQAAAATPTRRVRFSEPDCCAAAPATPARYCGKHSSSGSPAATQPAVLQATAAGASHSRAAHGDAAAQQQQQHQYLVSPPGSAPRPMLRSYCRGRFTVQEAVLFTYMPRSMSVPEHSCTLEQFVQDNAAAADQQGLLRHSSSGSDASSSSDACNGCSRDTGSSSQAQRFLHHHQQQEALAQVVVAAAAAADSFWAAASAAQLGDSSALGCTMSDDFAVYSSAAAAVGMPSRACRPHHHPPKRSQTVSYFRRGRFLVQTTYT